MCKILEKFIELYGSGSSIRQNTWFLKNNRAFSKFLCGTLHYLLSITKLSKNQSMEPKFILTTWATLTLMFG